VAAEALAALARVGDERFRPDTVRRMRRLSAREQAVVVSALWALLDLLANLATTPADIAFLYRLSGPIPVLLSYAILQAALAHAQLRLPVWGQALLLLPALVVTGLRVQGLLFESFVTANQHLGSYYAVPSTWFLISNVAHSLYLVGAIVVLIREARLHPSPTNQRVAHLVAAWIGPSCLGVCLAIYLAHLAPDGFVVPMLGSPIACLAALMATVTLVRETLILPLAKAQEQARQFEGLKMLAGGIAHDFNNLLVGILGHTRIAQQELDAGLLAQDRLERIETTARRAAELTHEMLAYAGYAKLRLHAVDVGDLTQDVARALEASLPKGVRIDLNSREQLPTVLADNGQLQQIILNLLTNAGEAMEGRGGSVQVVIAHQEVLNHRLVDAVSGASIAPGHYVTLQVSDTGAGIAPSELPRIFAPFYSTKFTGRGLGLAAVAGILKSHHGAITVASVVGKGSTFTVYLPVADNAVLTPPAAYRATRSHALQNGPHTVLIVDDEDLVRDVAQWTLNVAKYRVLTARDGIEAMALIRAHTEELSAVMLDLTMPRMNGRETLLELRRVSPDLPVVLTSGFDAEHALGELATDAGVTFLQKPFAPEQLLRSINDAMDRRVVAHD